MRKRTTTNTELFLQSISSLNLRFSLLAAFNRVFLKDKKTFVPPEIYKRPPVYRIESFYASLDALVSF